MSLPPPPRRRPARMSGSSGPKTCRQGKPPSTPRPERRRSNPDAARSPPPAPAGLPAGADGVLTADEPAPGACRSASEPPSPTTTPPWPPLTLGRHIGQEREIVDFVYPFYAGAAKRDTYEAVQEQPQPIHDKVSWYQPILYAPSSVRRTAPICQANSDRDII